MSNGHIIFVVGTARSGTSALAGLVERMGAKTLPKNVAGNYNPEYQENVVFNALAQTIHPWHKIDRRNATPALLTGMQAYISEHWHDRSVPMVVKCPNFPFILEELHALARNLEATPHFLLIVRNEKDQIASLQTFTLNNWDDDHWAHLLWSARSLMREDIQRKDLAMWIVYEDMLDNWKQTAVAIARAIPGLTVPEDGGIQPELNHHQGAESAKATETV